MTLLFDFIEKKQYLYYLPESLERLRGIPVSDNFPSRIQDLPLTGSGRNAY
jgi:hypothetical protein